VCQQTWTRRAPFVQGNAGGPGRPRRRAGDRLAAIDAGVTAEVWRRIVARAVADALAGDPRARALLSRYLIGEPSSQTRRAESPPVDHDESVTTRDRARLDQVRESIDPLD
jgi:hypothetical protein